jgi:hypothetical protein
MSFSDFIKNRSHSSGIYNFQSTNKLKEFKLGYYNVLEFYELISKELTKNLRKSYGYCEYPSDSQGFNFFLDIEDKQSEVIFDERILTRIINCVFDVVEEISEKTQKRVCDSVWICRNNKFHNYKCHLIFKNLIVDRVLLKYIINCIKERLPEGISKCIDSVATSHLRILGAKKYMMNEETKNVEVDLMAGFYTPNCYYDKVNDVFIYDKDSNHITLEKMKAFSLFIFDNLEEEDLILKINKTSIFYRCVVDPDRIRYEPPSFIDSNIFSKEDFVVMLRELIKTDGGKNLVNAKGTSTGTWLRLGKCCFFLGLDVKEWITISTCENYPDPKLECERTWRKFDDNEDDCNSYFLTLALWCKKYNSELFDRLMSGKEKQSLKDYKEECKKYHEKKADEVIDGMYKPVIDSKHIIKYERYVSKEILKVSEKIITISSPLGSGKTTAIIEFLKEMRNTYFERIIWLSPRKTFTDSLLKVLNNPENNLGFVSYEDVKGKIFDTQVVIQYESIDRLDFELMEGAILIADEFESILTQSQSSTNGLKKQDNINYLAKFIKTASKVILADAFLSSSTEKCLRSIGETDIINYNYVNRIKKPFINFQNIPKTKTEKMIRKSDLFWEKFYDSVEKRDKNFLFVSSRSKAIQVHNDLVEKGIKSIVYASNIKNSTKNVNELWKEYQVVICTTKITVGIDCQIEFDNVFAMISADVLARDAIQAIYRIRKVLKMTYICLNSVSRIGTRLPFVETELYKRLLALRDGKKMILKNWGFTKEFKMSIEGFSNQIFFSRVLERSINTTMHSHFTLRLLKNQGYYNVEEVGLDFTEEKEFEGETYKINIEEDYIKIPLLSDKDLEKILEKAKKTELSEMERACILKKRLDKISIFDKFYKEKMTQSISKSFVDDFWKGVIKSNTNIHKLEKLYILINKTKEQFAEKVGNDLIQTDNMIPKKEMFDKLMEYVEENELFLVSGEKIERKQVYDMFNILDKLDLIDDMRCGKFNANCTGDIKIRRVSAFLSNVFGVGLGSVEKKDRKRIRLDNGKEVDVSDFILKTTCDFNLMLIVKNGQFDF